MPTSTAATVMRASSPGERPVSVTGIASGPRGRVCAGGDSATSTSRALRSRENQARPRERPGSRRAA